MNRAIRLTYTRVVMEERLYNKMLNYKDGDNSGGFVAVVEK